MNRHGFSDRVSSPSTRQRGFTLIELMIAVAIVGILAAIALPAYKDSVLKGRRAQGRTALLEMAQAQERYYTANSKYTAVTTAAPLGFKTYSGDNATNAAYTITASIACSGTPTPSDKECVLMTATPSSADPVAGNLTMQSTGFKTCTGSNTSVCWP